MLRAPQEDERLGLSRRSFFFFGAIFAAKPEIIVPKAIEFDSNESPLIAYLAKLPKGRTATAALVEWREEEYLSRQGKLHELHLAPGDVLVLPSRTTNLGRQPVMGRVDGFDAAGQPLLSAIGGRRATTREIDCSEWLVVGQAYKEEA